MALSQSLSLILFLSTLTYQAHGYYLAGQGSVGSIELTGDEYDTDDAAAYGYIDAGSVDDAATTTKKPVTTTPQPTTTAKPETTTVITTPQPTTTEKPETTTVITTTPMPTTTEKPTEATKEEEDTPMPTGRNTACDKRTAIQSSTGKWAYAGFAERAVDNIKDTNVMKQGCTHTDRNDPNPWLMIDLGCAKDVNKVIIINRRNTPRRLANFVITVHHKLPNPDKITKLCKHVVGSLSAGTHTIQCDSAMRGRYVLIRFKEPSKLPAGSRFIHVCDVSVA